MSVLVPGRNKALSECPCHTTIQRSLTIRHRKPQFMTKVVERLAGTCCTSFHGWNPEIMHGAALLWLALFTALLPLSVQAVEAGQYGAIG